MTRTQEQHDTERLITARVRRGYTEHESRQLLDELIAAHNGDNLDMALKYNGFTRWEGTDAIDSAHDTYRTPAYAG